MLKRLHFLQVHLLIGILYLMLCFISSNELKAQKFTQYVDPLIGSGGHGHVFVGASVPFGAVQLGPNNIQLVAGGTLELIMTSIPNKEWGKVQL